VKRELSVKDPLLYQHLFSDTDWVLAQTDTVKYEQYSFVGLPSLPATHRLSHLSGRLGCIQADKIESSVVECGMSH
jgi:hypothetical protein